VSENTNELNLEYRKFYEDMTGTNFAAAARAAKEPAPKSNRALLYEDAIRDLAAALARIERLEAALRQYADPGNWLDGGETDCGYPLAPDWVGEGSGPDIARVALEAQP